MKSRRMFGKKSTKRKEKKKKGIGRLGKRAWRVFQLAIFDVSPFLSLHRYQNRRRKQKMPVIFIGGRRYVDQLHISQPNLITS